MIAYYFWLKSQERSVGTNLPEPVSFFCALLKSHARLVWNFLQSCSDGRQNICGSWCTADTVAETFLTNNAMQFNSCCTCTHPTLDMAAGHPDSHCYMSWCKAVNHVFWFYWEASIIIYNFIRYFPVSSPHLVIRLFYCGEHKSNQTPMKRWMEKLVLTSFISPTNCNIQRHTFSGEAREYRSVDHRGVWKTRYNLSAHKPSRLNVVTLCVKLHHHVLFTRSQHTNAECFIYVLKANSKQTYPKSFSFNTAVWKAKVLISSFVYCHRPESRQNLSFIFGVFTQTLQCLHGSFLLLILSRGNKHPHHR